MLPITYADLYGEHGLVCIGCKQKLQLKSNAVWHYVVQLGKPLIGPYCKWTCAQLDLSKRFCVQCHKPTPKNEPYVIETKTLEDGTQTGPFCDYQCARDYKNRILPKCNPNKNVAPALEPNALQFNETARCLT